MRISKWIEPSDSELRSCEDPDFFPSLHLSGHTFSPKRFTERTGIVCTEANEPNEIGVAGTYRGEQSPYGAAIIRPPKQINSRQSLFWIAEIVGSLTHKFRKEHGIIWETIYLTVRYKNQCCIILPGVILRTLGFPAIPLVVSCVRDSELQTDVSEDVSRLN